ncbi:MAG: substrate-binding domain-containing protein [Alphaproteobacteria bacterium]
MLKKTLIIAAGLTVAVSAYARDEIRIVGSSTVYPFAFKVADNFGRNTDYKSPVLESTGSGGGLKMFCGGVGEDYPDITNASRAIKDKEIKLCADNGVTEIMEVKIGYDGIVLANNLSGPDFSITREQLFEAVAAQLPNDEGKLVANPHTTWNQIDASLPAEKIEILGPPPSSGTRDAFVELVMEKSCDEIPAIKALKETDANAHKAACTTVRSDGLYIDAGEDDNLIVTKLEANPAAVGIFGYSFLNQNPDKIKGAKIENVAPTFDAIADGSYVVSRPLFFYVKLAHNSIVDGLQEYVETFLSEEAMGEDGYLVEEGLIPLPEAELEEIRTTAEEFSANLAISSN